MTEKNISVYNFFIINYFKFQFIFLCKNCKPPEKRSPSHYSNNAPFKIDILSSPLPPFWQMQLMYFMYFTCSYELWLLQLKKWLKMIWDK